MIKITFTCEACGNVEEIDYDVVDERRAVPVCDTCYTKFEKKKDNLKGQLKKLYLKYQIDCPDMEF